MSVHFPDSTNTEESHISRVCVCVCVCVCWEYYFFFLEKELFFFFCFQGVGSAPERLFLLISTLTHTHGSLLAVFVCVREREKNRHRSRDTRQRVFLSGKRYIFGDLQEDRPKTVILHTCMYTHNFQIRKGGESGCEFPLKGPSFDGGVICLQ